MWSFGIIKLHTNRLTGLFFAASFLLASVGAFYVAPGVDAQASVTPQKVTAIYDGYISVDPECATIPLKFTVEVWNVGSAGGGDYGNGTVVSEGPVCNVDSKGNATPGEYKTTTLSGTFSGGSNGVMVIVDPSQPKLDEKVLFIDGRIARLTISDGANSVHWDAQVINPEAFSGAAPLPATQPPLATQPPTATQLPAGNEPSSGNPTEPGGFNPISLLGIGGLLAGILGALLVALGIAAILIDGNRKADMPAPKPTGPKKNEPEPPQVSYTLNASSSAVDVYLGEPASVTFTALRISDAGSAVAMEATVKVIMAGSEAGLVASPGSAEGIMTCTFSLPTPRVCATQDVLAVALVDGTARARTLVKVHILPKYELELQWDDPQQLALQVDGKEALAWARVTATPPDPDATPDVLAQKVQVSLQGANTEWIRQPLAPYVQFEKQWNAIAMVHPAGSAEPGPGKPELVAEFSSGRQNLKARLPVEINQELALGAWVNGKKDADAVFQRKQAPPAWDFIEIHTYLHAPENEEKAIQPPFSIGDGPYIEATPPILEVKDHYGLADEPGRFVIQVVIKDGTDLETCFGPVPADQQMVKVKVYVRDDVGKEYYDVVTYHFRPTVTFCVHAYDNDPARPVALHSYRENVFTHEMEVVANADDCLCLAGYFMRTDLLAKTGPDPAKRLKFGDESIGEVRGFTWGNSQDQTDFGDPQVDEGQLGDGFLCFVLKSKVPLEATPERLDALHILNFQLAMRSDAYPLESDELELGVAMQLLRLRMWVVPGLVRHTSEVVAYLDMQPAGKPLEGQELILSTEAPADMSLELDDSQVGQKTYTAKEPCGAGAVKWRLCYSGITWNNMPQAEFVVRCGLEDPPDERWNSVAQINVYQNLRVFLERSGG